jgi:hypothetical protein
MAITVSTSCRIIAIDINHHPTMKLPLVARRRRRNRLIAKPNFPVEGVCVVAVLVNKPSNLANHDQDKIGTLRPTERLIFSLMAFLPQLLGVK